MTCDVIEVTTRRGKREEVFVGLYESGRGHGREEQGEEEEEEKRGPAGRLPRPLLGGGVKRLNKQVIGPRPQASAGIPTATRRPVVVGAGEGVT